jgi:hypothetical protein
VQAFASQSCYKPNKKEKYQKQVKHQELVNPIADSFHNSNNAKNSNLVTPHGSKKASRQLCCPDAFLVFIFF